jgi:hypothetical protein
VRDTDMKVLEVIKQEQLMYTDKYGTAPDIVFLHPDVFKLLQKEMVTHLSREAVPTGTSTVYGLRIQESNKVFIECVSSSELLTRLTEVHNELLYIIRSRSNPQLVNLVRKEVQRITSMLDIYDI